MGSGITIPIAPTKQSAFATAADGQYCQVTPKIAISEVFRISSAIFRIDCEPSRAQMTRIPQTNPVSECDDDDEDFESIIMGAVSNNTIREVLKQEMQHGTFAAFINAFYQQGPYQELLSHVMNIEKCRRSSRAGDVIQNELLRLYRFYEEKSDARSQKEESCRASVLIFKSLESQQQCGRRSNNSQSRVRRQRQSEDDDDDNDDNVVDVDVEQLSAKQLCRMMFRSQEEVLGLLAVPLSEFILSSEYDPEPYMDTDMAIEMEVRCDCATTYNNYSNSNSNAAQQDTGTHRRTSSSAGQGKIIATGTASPDNRTSSPSHTRIPPHRHSTNKYTRISGAKGESEVEAETGGPLTPFKALEASVNETLMGRFHEAKLSRFNLNLLSSMSTMSVVAPLSNNPCLCQGEEEQTANIGACC